MDEYTAGPLDELRIDKVYQLSLGDGPSGIPTGDFTRSGRLYYLLDMVHKDEAGVDTQTHTETVTLASDTDKMDAILQRLKGEMQLPRRAATPASCTWTTPASKSPRTAAPAKPPPCLPPGPSRGLFPCCSCGAVCRALTRL